MIARLWSVIARRRRGGRSWRPPARVVLTTECRDELVAWLREGTRRGHESIVYFLGLTTGTTTLALSAMRPEAHATATSVDVSAPALGGIIRTAAESGLQVVGQLHTHPAHAYHSAGDLAGMHIRHAGYFSIVIPDYGCRLPSLDAAHTLMWTSDGFYEIDEPVRIFERLTS